MAWIKNKKKKKNINFLESVDNTMLKQTSDLLLNDFKSSEKKSHKKFEGAVWNNAIRLKQLQMHIFLPRHSIRNNW